LGELVFSGKSLAHIPALVKRVLQEESWRYRIIEKTGEECRFAADEFVRFVTTPPLEGLGATVEALKNLCRDDRVAYDLIEQATQQADGGNNNPYGCKGKQIDPINVDNINVDSKPEIPKRPIGTSRDAALRRLRKDRPDLHQRVLAGELTPHAAMKAAGFRKVPTALEVAQKAYRKLGPKERATFLEWVKQQ
jgi:hypothetical protein